MAEIDSDRQTFASDFFERDTEQAVFTGDAVTDKLMHAVIALGSEVWTLRQRGQILERLLADKGVSHEMVEGYIPTEEENSVWKADREAYVDRIYSVFARNSTMGMKTDWPKADEG